MISSRRPGSAGGGLVSQLEVIQIDAVISGQRLDSAASPTIDMVISGRRLGPAGGGLASQLEVIQLIVVQLAAQLAVQLRHFAVCLSDSKV